jgi:hypothetical protein
MCLPDAKEIGAEQDWNQTGKRISYLRCDNAKEFLSSAFNEYLSTQGTVLQDIRDYTPELNGTAERNIRTVMNMMRSMLKGAGLPKNLWAEAITAACYIKNRFTSSGKSTSHELWFGTKPDVSGLRIYGCTAFVHVPKEKRKALDDRSEECILIGYGSGNIYRLLTKKTRKLIIARDVKFDESLLGFGNFRNKVEPLYINDDDDDEEKKDAQAPIEDVKEPTSEKPAFKIAKEVQPVLRRSLRLKANEDAKKEEEEKKDSDSILTDIETYSDSEPPEESGESSQGILNSIGGLFSRFSGAAVNITESTSSMVLEMVYGVSYETEPTSFQDAISGPESKEWIEAIQSEVFSVEENQTWEPRCLPTGRKAIPIKRVFKKKTNAEGKFADIRQNWSAKDLCKEKALISLKLLLQLQSFNPSDI